MRTPSSLLEATDTHVAKRVPTNPVKLVNMSDKEAGQLKLGRRTSRRKGMRSRRERSRRKRRKKRTMISKRNIYERVDVKTD